MCKTRTVLGYEKEAILAFGLSKMAVWKDSTKKGKIDNNKVSFVEFLEFIGRSTVMAFKSQTDLTYVQGKNNLKKCPEPDLDIYHTELEV